MQLTCPECQALCTFDEQNAEGVLCPGCGRVIFSRSSTPPRRTPPETPKGDDETRVFDVAPAEPVFDSTTFPVEVGRYRIESELGHGGSGRVYRATDALLGRVVALKVPKATPYVAAERIERFLAEGKNAAQLKHPGIVTIYDVGELRPKVPYIAMEYIEGTSLHDRMRQERLPLREGVELLAKIAEAVHYAHGQGQVHRDLKPSNILLDAQSQPRIVDFGLAVHEDAQPALRGQVAGTWPYMAPEQFRGEAHYLDGRCDIWSLGVILYQVLTGRRPFRGEVDDLYDQVLNRDPKPPRQINDAVPAELESICLRCLAKSPAERYTTARDLADALRDWLRPTLDDTALADAAPRAAQPLIAAPPVPSRPSWRTALIAAGIVLAAGALLFALGPFSPGRKPRDEGREPIAGGIEAPRPPLEELGKTLVWMPLLDHGPRPLAWGGDSEISHWSRRADLPELSVISPDIGFFGLGSTRLSNFRLQTQLTRSNWEGHSGLFWGYQELEENDQRVATCEALSLSDTGDSPGDVDLVRQKYVFRWIKGIAKPQLTRESLRAEPLARPEGAEVPLEIAVTDGWLSEVLLQGKRYPLLQDQPPVDAPVPHGQLAWVGVFHDGGVTTFREARVKLLPGITTPTQEPP